MSERLAVFAYASLVSLDSAARTLGRPVGAAPPARLAGFERNWTLVRDNHRSEKTFARPDGSLPGWCLGLNLVPGADPQATSPGPNGALIEVTAAELDRLDIREIRYRRVEVAPTVTLGDGSAHEFDSVTAYCARPENFSPEPPPESVILAPYPRAIEAAFAERGDDELALYLETTARPPVDLVEGTLVGDRIPEGNPREW